MNSFLFDQCSVTPGGQYLNQTTCMENCAAPAPPAPPGCALPLYTSHATTMVLSEQGLSVSDNTTIYYDALNLQYLLSMVAVFKNLTSGLIVDMLSKQFQFDGIGFDYYVATVNGSQYERCLRGDPFVPDCLPADATTTPVDIGVDGDDLKALFSRIGNSTSAEGGVVYAVNSAKYSAPISVSGADITRGTAFNIMYMNTVPSIASISVFHVPAACSQLKSSSAELGVPQHLTAVFQTSAKALHTVNMAMRRRNFKHVDVRNGAEP